MADQVEEVPGGSNINNYANVDLIVEIAGIFNFFFSFIKNFFL